MTARNERFIALHMMYDRIAPEDPTRAPVMISRLLLSMKPAAAAAHPEYEFSIDTTTGMSPPPIAATRCSPSSSAITVISSSGQMLGAAMNQAEQGGADHQRAEVQPVPARQGQRRRLDLRGQLQVGDDRSR